MTSSLCSCSTSFDDGTKQTTSAHTILKANSLSNHQSIIVVNRDIFGFIQYCQTQYAGPLSSLCFIIYFVVLHLLRPLFYVRLFLLLCSSSWIPSPSTTAYLFAIFYPHLCEGEPSPPPETKKPPLVLLASLKRKTSFA